MAKFRDCRSIEHIPWIVYRSSQYDVALTVFRRRRLSGQNYAAELFHQNQHLQLLLCGKLCLKIGFLGACRERKMQQISTHSKVALCFTRGRCEMVFGALTTPYRIDDAMCIDSDQKNKNNFDFKNLRSYI
jgi:hypothetical protein